jgi:hypothetical protein
MGINSSNWSNTDWTINGPSDSYLYSSGGDLALGTIGNYQLQFFANGSLANNEAMRIDSGANVNIGNTKAGATSLTVGNNTVNVVVNSSSFNINTVFTANSTVVNAVSYRVNTQFVANSTGVFSTGTVNANAFTTTSVTINTVALAIGSNVVVNTSSYFVGNSTVYANVVAGEITLSSNSTNAALINSTSFTGTANNASYLGNTAAASYVQNTDSRTLSGNLAFSGANVYYSSGLFVGTKMVVNTSTVFVGNSTVNTVTTEGQISLSGQTINSTAYTGLAYTANNASYLNGLAAANYVQNSGAYTFSGVHTHSANVVFSNGNVLIANGGFGTNTQVLISNGTSMYWGTFSANDALSLGGTNAAFYVVNTDSRTLSGNLIFSGANVTFTGNLRIANGVSLIANASMGSDGQVLTSNGTSLYWQTLSGVNTAAAYTWTGVHTHSANVIYSNASVIQANAGFGTAGQVLTSNGSSMYWSNPVTIYYANGSQAYP